MARETGISWADSTANFWIGCSPVSAACDKRYAEAMMGGLGAEPVPGEGRRFRRVAWGPHGDRSYCKQGWADARRWQRLAAANGGLDPDLGRKRRVFVNSLADFFDNHKSITWRDDAWTGVFTLPGNARREAKGKINWIIIGGESGVDPRPLNENAALNIIDQAKPHGAAVHFKQRSQADHPRTYDKPDTFPENLKIREFPNEK